MTIDAILFYLFSIFSLISALLVISSLNAVHSVLFLILVFLNVVGLLLLLGAEFLSFIFLVIYVGAIAVLFLFVVMMLNVKAILKERNTFSIFPIGFFIFITLFAHISSAIDIDFTSFLIIYEPKWVSWANETDTKFNIETIGYVLYTEFSLIFLISSIILLVAMLGAIVLTMHQRPLVKKQSITGQILRDPCGVVKFINLRK